MAASSESLFTLFRQAYSRGNYFRTKGTSPRRAYWAFILFYYIVLFACGLLLMTVAAVLGNPSSRTLLIASAPAVVFALVSFVPFLTVVVRRLHDAGHSGGWVLLLLFLVWAGNTAVDALPDNPVAYCVQLLAPLCLLLIGLLPSKDSKYREAEAPKAD
jgi:uncharacterized membrane protein YhaH (DUF805 family)